MSGLRTRRDWLFARQNQIFKFSLCYVTGLCLLQSNYIGTEILENQFILERLTLSWSEFTCRSVCHTIGLFVFPWGNGFWERGKSNSSFSVKESLQFMDQNSECSHSCWNYGEGRKQASPISNCFSRPLCRKPTFQVLGNPSPGGCHLLEAPSLAVDHFPSCLPFFPSCIFPMLSCFSLGAGWILWLWKTRGFVACRSCSTSGTILIILLCLFRRTPVGYFPWPSVYLSRHSVSLSSDDCNFLPQERCSLSDCYH